MNPDRRRRLIALADWHQEWVEANLARASAEFDSRGRKPGSDYNQHHVDVDADDDEFHAEARRILGIT